MGGQRQYEGVRAASASTIEIDFYYQDARCRERLKLQPTPANLKRASQHRAAVLDAIDKGTFDYATTFPNSVRRVSNRSAPLTVGEYLNQWYTREQEQYKHSVRADMRRTVKLLSDGIGLIYLDELKRADVREWCATMTCGNKRLSNIQSVLRHALHQAVSEDELIDVNPMVGWKYERRDAPKADDDVDPFTAEEQAAILMQADGQGRNLIQFNLWTGMRPSEVCALQWPDIDWVAGHARVWRAITQGSTEAEEPKTKAGIRDVKLLQPALDALLAQKQHTFLAGAHIFHNPRTDAPWAGDQPIRHGLWTRTLRLAGVRYRRPYQTRHTYASMMLTAGESPMWVAQQMGHRDWGMIRRIYGRWISDAQPDAGLRAEALFGGTLKLREEQV
jgi:integrase